MSENPYLPPQSKAPAPIRHSGRGIASLSFVTVSLAIEAGSIMFIAIADGEPGGRPVQTSEGTKVLVLLLILGGILCNVVGITFGFAALFQRDRNKQFAQLGITLGFATFALLGCAFVVGLGKASP